MDQSEARMSPSDQSEADMTSARALTLTLSITRVSVLGGDQEKEFCKSEFCAVMMHFTVLKTQSQWDGWLSIFIIYP